MSEKSKNLKKMQRELLKSKRLYEKTHRQIREVLCDSCLLFSTCKRTKGQLSCKLYQKGDEINDHQSDAHPQSDTNEEAA